MQRWFMLLVIIHGAIHGLGFAKAFFPTTVQVLAGPISRPLGLLWLVAGLLVIVSAFTPMRAFWIIGMLALVISQIAIGTAWSDAKFGTAINVAMLLAAVYSFASEGPLSFAAQYRRDSTAALARIAPAPLLEESDLTALPLPVQRYLRVTGAVGQPRIFNVRARWSGRMRGAANEAWMKVHAEQLNTFVPESRRFFHLGARMKGLPVDVYHRFIREAATFQVRALSMIPMVDAVGPEMTRAETVTILNDMCLIAPAALIDPALHWQALDKDRVRVSYTRGHETVTAELHFDDAGLLSNFISDDRQRASPDGKTFLRQRWSTPAGSYRSFAGRQISAQAVARWHAPEGTFDYADFALESVEYNVRDLDAAR